VPAAIAALDAGDTIFDGELVALGADGRSDFRAVRSDGAPAAARLACFG
jgi:ATP-dependent DNA ligase